MDFDSIVENFFGNTYFCKGCDSSGCRNNMCDHLNWTDDEVIEEFIIELNVDADGELTLELIQDWYWDELQT